MIIARSTSLPYRQRWNCTTAICLKSWRVINTSKRPSVLLNLKRACQCRIFNRMRSAEKRQEALRRHHLEQMTGADLTKLPGLDLLAVERILSEIGLDMSRWPERKKHFCAWLNVAPNNRISGGQILPSKPRKNANRAAAALRLAVRARMQSKSAIGAFIRRIKSHLGAPTAINAGAHKLARLVYRMLKFGKAYVETGQEAYEKLFKGTDTPQPSAQGSPTRLSSHSHNNPHRSGFLGGVCFLTSRRRGM